MADIRIPRGYGRYQTPYNEVFEGQRPSLSELGNLLPAPWLPVCTVDTVHDDPIVMQAGTWVGRINSTDHSAAYTAVTAASRTNFLVPAFQGTGEYSVTYGSQDLDNGNGTYAVPDIDSYPTAVAATGVSSTTVGPVKPLGVLYQDAYGSYMSLRYKNYSRQHMVGFLAYGQVIMVPAMTSEEVLIEPNDLVMIHRSTDASPTWRPQHADNYVGHLAAWDHTNGNVEYIVGRCLEKVLIADGGGASQRLSAAVTAGTATNIHNFNDLGKVQTVPGLGTQGSGTLGIPGFLLPAVAQRGDFYGLLISVGAV
jgi:hypothetical protein